MWSAAMGLDSESALPLDVLCVDIVERYHAALHRSLPRIRDELAALCGLGASQELCAVRVAFSDLADQIEGHLAKEEHLLFPELEALAVADRETGRRPATAFVTVLHPIRLMETEHARIETALEQLHGLVLEVSEPESLSPRWRRCLAELAVLDRDLRDHHRAENQVLFPRALDLERRLL
jgi:regulator of cell morphogenesis and NO signaling